MSPNFKHLIGCALGGLIAVASAGAATVDTTTQGNWIGVYGSQGYILPYYNGAPGDQIPLTTASDIAQLPSYVSGYSYGTATDTDEMRGHVWAFGTTDVRAPENPTKPTPLTDPRNANTAYTNGVVSDPGVITINLSQPATFKLGIYGLDWDLNNRDVTVSVGADSVHFTQGSGYETGEWAIFTITAPAGPLTIDLSKTPGTSNAVISAITFDAVPEPASLTLLGLGAAGCLVRRRPRQ